MGFLLRTVFWFSLVLLFLPIDLGEEDTGQDQVGAIRAFVAASAAVDDVTGLCERKPDVCETGKAAFHTIGVRARETVRIAYDLLEEEGGTADEALHTGSVGVPTPAPRPALPVE